MTNPTTTHSAPPETPESPQAGAPENPPCSDCASREVHPSRSVYPLDHARIGGEARGFWRCANCGTRFLGPIAAEAEKRRRRSKRDPLDGAIQRSRRQKQWVFPLLVVLATILAVVYVLDRRNTEAPAVTFPDQ